MLKFKKKHTSYITYFKLFRCVFLLQENCNLQVSNEYNDHTRRAMAMMTERELSFELIEALIKYIKELGEPGSILVFLPGWNLIFMLMRHLQQHPEFGQCVCG